VLADALAYAARRLRPDLVVDLATLTGAQSVALGKRTRRPVQRERHPRRQLLTAAAAAGESVWRMPLDDDYVEALGSDVADLVNSTDVGAGSMLAALFLREFTGRPVTAGPTSTCRPRPGPTPPTPNWSRAATGWGVRTSCAGWRRSPERPPHAALLLAPDPTGLAAVAGTDPLSAACSARTLVR